jgi:hypothetical protein
MARREESAYSPQVTPGATPPAQDYFRNFNKTASAEVYEECIDEVVLPVWKRGGRC